MPWRTVFNSRPEQRACDIGCGYGATARQLAERQGAQVTGVTVSAAGGSMAISQQDRFASGFSAGSFDCAYAIVSSGHMQDRQRFIDETFRVLKPRGVLVVCAWLPRTSAGPGEVKYLIEPICWGGRMTGVGDEEDSRRFAERAAFGLNSVDDLSARVRQM